MSDKEEESNGKCDSLTTWNDDSVGCVGRNKSQAMESPVAKALRKVFRSRSSSPRFFATLTSAGERKSKGNAEVKDTSSMGGYIGDESDLEDNETFLTPRRSSPGSKFRLQTAVNSPSSCFHSDASNSSKAELQNFANTKEREKNRSSRECCSDASQDGENHGAPKVMVGVDDDFSPAGKGRSSIQSDDSCYFRHYCEEEANDRESALIAPKRVRRVFKSLATWKTSKSDKQHQEDSRGVEKYSPESDTFITRANDEPETYHNYDKVPESGLKKLQRFTRTLHKDKRKNSPSEFGDELTVRTFLAEASSEESIPSSLQGKCLRKGTFKELGNFLMTDDSFSGTTIKSSKSFGEKVAEYLQRGGSRLQEQQRRLKSQIWSSVVTIILVEGKDIPVMDRVGFADPYVKFRLGNEKYKSKVELRTLNPRWLEQFDFHLFEDQSQLLDISLWDKDPKAKDEFIGKCTLDLRNYEKENTHEVWLDLEGEGEINEGKVVGRLFLLLSISGTTSSTSISDLVTHKENPHEIRAITNKYRLWRTLHNLRDVGLLTVKVFKAQGLAAADFGVGKSDPFCVLELLNARLQTQTEYKTLTPCWNKIFTFDVKDIHSILEVTVYDEDRDHKVDFLGKMSVPLIKIKNGEKKWYALKDKKLRLRAKGNYPEILLECSIFWNPIRAAIETFDPKEEKYMQLEPRFKRQIFVRNVNRIRAVVVDAIDFGLYIKSCFEWESPLRSVVAFLLFILITYYFELYMLPAFLLLLFVKNYIVISIVGSRYYKDEDAESSGNEDEIDEDDKDKEEKKSIKERLQAIQEVIATVQNAIGYIASIVESVKNTFNFTVPFLSWLMVLVLLAILVVLYMVPCRFLVIFWGVNKFSRKLIRPHSVVNNEIMDFLSRVPDDEELKDYRELKTSFQSSDRREKKKKAAS